jgi:hypothetical protein
MTVLLPPPWRSRDYLQEGKSRVGFVSASRPLSIRVVEVVGAQPNRQVGAVRLCYCSSRIADFD